MEISDQTAFLKCIHEKRMFIKKKRQEKEQNNSKITTSKLSYCLLDYNSKTTPHKDEDILTSDLNIQPRIPAFTNLSFIIWLNVSIRCYICSLWLGMTLTFDYWKRWILLMIQSYTTVLRICIFFCQDIILLLWWFI